MIVKQAICELIAKYLHAQGHRELAKQLREVKWIPCDGGPYAQLLVTGIPESGYYLGMSWTDTGAIKKYDVPEVVHKITKPTRGRIVVEIEGIVIEPPTRCKCCGQEIAG